MQPALTQPLIEPTLAQPSELNTFGPPWVAVAAWFALALVASMLAHRGANAPPLRRWQRLLHILAVAGWTVTACFAGLRLVYRPLPTETAVRGLLLLIVVAVALPILRDLFAGLAIAIEGRYGIGDDVRIDTREGRIVTFGLRSVVLRDIDGTEITLPNRRFAAREIQRLNLARQDAPCQFEVAVGPNADLQELTRRLFEAAMLSPYAAPGRRADVFAVADERGNMRLRVRAFVFDRAYEERYRGDVLSRAEMLGPPDSIASSST
jgi:small-conductance mechanosensitive channel